MERARASAEGEETPEKPRPTVGNPAKAKAFFGWLRRLFRRRKQRDAADRNAVARAARGEADGVNGGSHVGERVEFEPKRLLSIAARAELDAFLASGEILQFPVLDRPDLSVVVVLWNQAHLTLRCLRALLAQDYLNIELVLVDNASSDRTNALLSRLRGVQVIRSDSNEGFLLGANRGAAAARGRCLLFLNNDCFVRRHALSAAMETMRSGKDIGVVGGRLLLLNDMLQEAGSIIWSDGSTIGYGRGLDPEAAEAMYRRDVDYCSGAFLLTRRELWRKLGGFDPGFAPAYFEEVDYCVRAWKAGKRVVYEPRAAIDHFEFGSEANSGDATALMIRNRNIFLERHGAVLRECHLSQEFSKLEAREHAPKQRRRLLVIDDLVPLNSLGSGFPRTRHLLAAAVSLGWSVTLYSTHQSDLDWEETRREIPWEVEIVTRKWPLGPVDFIQERAGYYHCFFVSRPNNLVMLKNGMRAFPELIGDARLIYDAEAVFSLREIAEAAVEGKPISEAEANRKIAEEVALAEGVDAVVCVTKAEADLFRTRQAQEPPVPVHVISHPTYSAKNPPRFHNRSGFLFVGRLLEKRAPNWRGLAWFVTYCWPLIRASLPQATLTIAGRVHAEHRELTGPGIHFAGAVDNLQPLYDSVRVFVAPVRFAAGVPIKILEATAAGLPTAGTRLMAKQMGWTAGIEMMAEDSPLNLATEACRLHEEQDVWEAMLRVAQQSVLREHDAETFRNGVRDLLDGTRE
jgi:GT2 family glycosyltransferase